MHFDPPRPRSDDERILPLINVVFLLLIFFMLAGQLSAIDPIEIEPPRSVSEGRSATASWSSCSAPTGAWRSTVSSSMKKTWSGRSQSACGDASPRVWLKADGAANSTAVIAVMDSLREAGVERLKLLTTPVPTSMPAPAPEQPPAPTGAGTESAAGAGTGAAAGASG